MQLASSVADEILVGPSTKEKILVPRTIKPSPPLRLQLAPFRLAQYTRGLIQNRSLVSEARKPKTLFGSLVQPPSLRPTAILPPSLHDAITVTKPRRTPLLVALKRRTIVRRTKPKFQLLSMGQLGLVRAPEMSSRRHFDLGPRLSPNRSNVR